MKKIFLVALVIWSCSVGAQQLRVMTYNIRHCEDSSGKISVAGTAGVIRASGARIVLLQEVDSVTRRDGGIDEMKELGRLTGLHPVFGRHFAYDGGAYGLGILSAYPVESVESLRLPYYPNDVNGDSRLLFVATLRIDAHTRLRVATVHLDYKTAEQRAVQAEYINKLSSLFDATPLLLAGDLNALPDEPAIAVLKRRFREADPTNTDQTYPATSPHKKIDYILVSPASAFGAGSTRVIDERFVSDHRPVICDLALRAQTIHPAVRLTSPDGRLKFQITSSADEVLYSLSRGATAVLQPSRMGMQLNGQRLRPARNIRILHRYAVNETFPTRGVHSAGHSRANGAKLFIGMSGNDTICADVRVFNDGIAFSYFSPGGGAVQQDDDLTSFNLPAGSMAWSQSNPRNYEARYTESLVDTLSPGLIAGPPLTAAVKGVGFIVVTEAGLTDFSGMSLRGSGSGLFQSQLAAISQTGRSLRSPWRVILVSPDLDGLVNSEIVAAVSPPMNKRLFPDAYATSWVEPGKCTWSWLAENGPVSYENMRRFSYWAGQLGIPYNLVDEGWARWKDGNKDYWQLMKELVAYADSQHVKTWVWKAYPDRAGVEGLTDSAKLMSFLTRCRDIGLVGVKIDFFDSERQEVIRFYQTALRFAAQLHLMLDFHGANKPTGETRTWPNEMSREGIRGLENGGTKWPVHDAVLPFTRFVAGHGDYTPLKSGKRTAGTTLTHQIATLVVFTSPFMCLAEDPEILLKESYWKDFARDIPTVWDETRVLKPSFPGQLAILARRHGRDWWLGVLNGAESRTVQVPLTFLGSGTFNCLRMEDGTDPATTVESHSQVRASGVLTIQVPAGGGFAARFEGSK